MKNNYTIVVSLFISLNIAVFASAQPQFLDTISILPLCTMDEGVRLPSNNQLYIGEENPEATSCSVHITWGIRVKIDCGLQLMYQVQLLLNGAGEPIELTGHINASADSLLEVAIGFDTETAIDSLIQSEGIPYVRNCLVHIIRCIVTDSCGNSASFEQKLHLYDCQDPQYELRNDVFIVNSFLAGHYTLNIDTFILSFQDDCTGSSDFLMSLSPQNHLTEINGIICDVPAFGVEIWVPFWIAEIGIDEDCNGEIIWNERRIVADSFRVVYRDNFGGCDPVGEDYYISGEILTEDFQSVEKVVVTLTSPGHVFPTYVTNEDGKYHFNTLPGDYEITAERNDDHKNGVSTLDLIKILKHLLGREIIESPYDLIAADANNSQNVSAIDLVVLRKLILGIYTELPNNNSWRFVAEDFVFPDPTSPWPFDEVIDSTNMTGGGLRQDFIAVKIGDINNTVQPNAQSLEARSPRETINWTVEQQEFQANELIEIDFSMDNALMIQGFQFTISSTDLEFIDITSDMIEIGEENFALFGDKLTLSWFDEKGALLSHGDKIFTLLVRAKSDGSLKQNLTLNSDITEAEIYSMNEEILDPKLVISEKENITAIYAPQPNPWKGQTSIPFYLQRPGLVTFEIYDLSGRPVYAQSKKFDVGINVLYVQSDDFNSRGVLYYSIKSGETYLTSKLLVLE